MDEGQHDLESRRKELLKIIHKEIDSFENEVESEKPMTSKEQFLKMALESKSQHAKAKLLILQLIEKIHLEGKKNAKKKVGEPRN